VSRRWIAPNSDESPGDDSQGFWIDTASNITLSTSGRDCRPAGARALWGALSRWLTPTGH